MHTGVLYAFQIREDTGGEIVGAERKVTVMLPKDLLSAALEASGEGITPTLRRGLELVAAKRAYKKLLALKGKVDLKLDVDRSREGREN